MIKLLLFYVVFFTLVGTVIYSARVMLRSRSTSLVEQVLAARREKLIFLTALAVTALFVAAVAVWGSVTDSGTVRSFVFYAPVVYLAFWALPRLFFKVADPGLAQK